MATYKMLIDNCVRHLTPLFPAKQTIQLEDAGLNAKSKDEEIVAVASENKYIIVTNNAKDFEKFVPDHISGSSKKRLGCQQVHGLIIVLPSERLKQESAVTHALRQMRFEGRNIGWKEVKSLCLKVSISESGKATVTKLPRCPHCNFDDEDD